MTRSEDPRGRRSWMLFRSSTRANDAQPRCFVVEVVPADDDPFTAIFSRAQGSRRKSFQSIFGAGSRAVRQFRRSPSRRARHSTGRHLRRTRTEPSAKRLHATQGLAPRPSHLANPRCRASSGWVTLSRLWRRDRNASPPSTNGDHPEIPRPLFAKGGGDRFGR